MEQLVRAEGAFVVHGGAAVDPIPDVVVGHASLSRKLDFPERAECSQAARRFSGIEIEVYAAQRAPADVADSDAKEFSARIAIGEFECVDGCVVEERDERFRLRL